MALRRLRSFLRSTIEVNLASDIAKVRKSIRALEKDLLAFEDIKQLKLWLKRLQRQAAMNPFDDMSF